VPSIECSYLTKTERRKLALALNRTAETGEWDFELLKIEFAELIELDVDLSPTGFSVQEQHIILLDDGSNEEEDQVDDRPSEPVTQLGDVWELDDHRVICGSAIEPSVYEKLLLGVLVAIIIADFPYNVCIGNNVSGLGKKKHAEFKMASGEMTDAEFAAFLEATIICAVAHLVAGGVFYGFMDWRSIDKLYRAGSAALLTLLNLVVWYKQSGAMGAFYRSAHELIAVLCKGDKPRTNNIGLGKNGRDRCNVWCMPGANRPGSSAHEMLGEHATPKPVELCVDAILDVTLPGEAVLDPFLGSGTTLIAAEKTGRRCYGIELEPGFVDVTIMRWQRLTGKQAVLADTGQTFDALAQSRRAPDPAP
jgi:DNA modification methylase